MEDKQQPETNQKLEKQHAEREKKNTNEQNKKQRQNKNIKPLDLEFFTQWTYLLKMKVKLRLFQTSKGERIYHEKPHTMRKENGIRQRSGSTQERNEL